MDVISLSKSKQAADIAVSVDANVESFKTDVKIDLDRIDFLEQSIFADFTSNPFLILFDDLDGIDVKNGVWNQTAQRLEC